MFCKAIIKYGKNKDSICGCLCKKSFEYCNRHINNQLEYSNNLNTNKIQNQSQKHGFTYENNIKRNVFNLEPEINNIDKYDINCNNNKFNKNENISIKCTKSNKIDCGSIERFYDYDFTKKNTIIVVQYKQVGQYKIIKKCYEIDYNEKCHKLLFGSLTKDIIKSYVKYITSIPHGKVDNNIKKEYKNKKKHIQEEYNCRITINPKVDSKTQRRVQCSITNFETLLKDYIIYKSQDEYPNLIRECEIPLSIDSSIRKRNTI